MSGTPKYARRAQNSARDALAVVYMKVNAVSQIAHAPAIAANVSVTREMRRRRTLEPKITINSEVIAVGSADGDRPC